MAGQTIESERLGTFEFGGGDYVANLDGYELTHRGEAVAIEPQVFALLAYLLRNNDRVVPKDELLDELWGHRYVSESALSTQIKSLRRVVGDDGARQDVIQTVRGRGFRFVADLGPAPPQPSPEPHTTAHNLPRERTQLFGRDEDAARCRVLLEQNRLVTILGIGGTGKTRLGARVGRDSVPEYPDGVWFIDLIPITNIDALETAVADTLGLAPDAGATRPQLINALETRNTLLIFDNCEHVRKETADLLNDLLEYTRVPRFLATSRDPLDLPDEQRFFLDPLSTFSTEGDPPAVDLFRVTAERHGVNLALEDITSIQIVCEQLDGLPLAIELAAAQLRHLTLQELTTRLQQRFEVLAGRERGPSGRQTHLLGVLEDTWGMLSDAEQALLKQLAVYPRRFSMAGVERLLRDQPDADISLPMSRLVDLGLIQRTSAQGIWWRLLETVRMFCFERFSPEEQTANPRRHAEWSLEALGSFPDDQLDNLSQAEWCLDHYEDLVAAEQYFAENNLNKAYAVCCGTGLMVQLDDGARAREKLLRAQSYLDEKPDKYWQARLHAIAGLCAQANRNPALLLQHTEAYLELARTLDDPSLLANALLMKSLTTGFVDPELAQRQLQEMIDIGTRIDNQSLVDSGDCYRAWQFAVARQYDEAKVVAREVVSRYEAHPDSIDNPAYNAIGVIITCTVVHDPEEAARWAARMDDFPAVTRFWGIENLIAGVEASNEDYAASAARCLAIKARLNRATRDEFPDILVTAALMSYRQNDLERTRNWLAAIRYSGIPIQMYHMIAIYRQLYESVGFGDYDEDSAPGLDDVRQGVNDWLISLSQA